MSQKKPTKTTGCKQCCGVPFHGNLFTIALLLLVTVLSAIMLQSAGLLGL